MKTKLHLLSLLLIPALLTSCPEKGGSSTSALRVAVCQPESLETVPTLMDSLKHALAENKQAGSAGLEVRVIVSEDEIVTIPAPKVESVMVNLFGPSTPYALQKKLEAHLAAVEERLKAGCPAKPVSLATLKSAPQALYGAEDYVVWALQGDARSVWSGAEKTPKAVVTDAETLAATLDAASTQNLLVLNSSVKAPVVIAAKKPVKKVPVVAKAKAVPVSAPKAPAPQAPMPAAAQGSTVVLNVGAPMRETSASGVSHSQSAIGFDHAELFDTILHDSGMSAPRDKQQIIQDAERLKALREHYEFQVVIISRADKQKGSTKDRNQQLSEQRARICKAMLIEQGVPVHDCVFIGDDAAEGTSERDRGTQIHLLNKKPRGEAKSGNTASR
jgi:outer membrane protein OmpA-like peptidoglycan-associated protein